MFEKKAKNELDDDSTKSFFSKTTPKESAKCHLGNGVKCKGEITGADEVIVEGDVNVKMDTNKLTIGSMGKLRGKISANTVEVKGIIKGTLKVSDTLTIYDLGHVSGKIEYNSLEIKLGGYISGEIKSEEKIKKIY
jgi:cytoskeletal protein CcmA (bactofilin family)